MCRIYAESVRSNWKHEKNNNRIYDHLHDRFVQREERKQQHTKNIL